METDDRTTPPPSAEAPASVRPRPSWYLRWGKASALWLSGFAVGAALVYGAMWGVTEYESYRALQAINLPPPVADNSAARLFAPEEKPPAPEPPAAATAVAATPVPAPAAMPPAPAKPAAARIAKAKPPVRRQLASKAPARKLVTVKQARRLAANGPAPRIIEIRRVNRRPCQRGDLARECYAAR